MKCAHWDQTDLDSDLVIPLMSFVILDRLLNLSLFMSFYIKW